MDFQVGLCQVSTGQPKVYKCHWTKRNNENWEVTCANRLATSLSHSVSFSPRFSRNANTKLFQLSWDLKCCFLGIRTVGNDISINNKKWCWNSVFPAFQKADRVQGWGSQEVHGQHSASSLFFRLHHPCLTETWLLRIYFMEIIQDMGRGVLHYLYKTGSKERRKEGEKWHKRKKEVFPENNIQWGNKKQYLQVT